MVIVVLNGFHQAQVLQVQVLRVNLVFYVEKDIDIDVTEIEEVDVVDVVDITNIITIIVVDKK